ncbi:hypothetical protein EIL87_11130 [Saccharopolyspora rhizosphaerae]|uniref:Uncharacterized protein n=1 Tax=Saccharopolyspora rhizosphaerae TaxID=2492662 RepID=A0A3R8P0L6_9PSEU|nr:hypothetical protein [Saccharopolyspora rhizosphaerae]RRO17339.1 hypothetical protein EIL87_11130 [Saccharopolyspora rhizosphaerae]
MTYPPRPDPHGAQSGPYPGGWGTGGVHGPQDYQYPQQGSDAFWRQVASNQPPPPPPQKKRTGLIIGITLGAALVLVGGIVAISLAVIASNRIEAGGCMSLRDERGGPMAAADCGTPESDYEVVDVQEGRNLAGCGDDYVNYADGTTYCIVLDVQAGDCLTPFQQDESVLPLKIECAKSEDQVSRVVGGQDPGAACEENEGYYVFSRKTVCFGDVQGT